MGPRRACRERVYVQLTEDEVGPAASRMLKYTPEHAHCLANVYGALAPPGTGVLAIQSLAANQQARSGQSNPAPGRKCGFLLRGRHIIHQ